MIIVIYMLIQIFWWYKAMVIDFSTKLFRVYFSKLGEEAFSGKLGKILMQINKTEKRNCDLVPSR